MFRTVKGIKDYVLAARDGEIGACRDFLFDGADWHIRYMVADTRAWLPGRKVLITPDSLQEPDWETRRLPVALTRREIRESPPLQAEAAVSTDYERQWHRHYGRRPYWVDAALPGASSRPGRQPQAEVGEAVRGENQGVFSANDTIGYDVHAADGAFGHVGDLMMELPHWIIRYIIIDTGRWLPGKQVCVIPDAVKRLDRIRGEMEIALTAAQLQAAPDYEPAPLMNREYQVVLHDYYGWPRYWEK
jgi:hypothetical protein